MVGHVESRDLRIFTLLCFKSKSPFPPPIWTTFVNVDAAATRRTEAKAAPPGTVCHATVSLHRPFLRP